MAVNFCTMPTQHGTTGILFPKLTAQLKFSKIQIIYICIYIYIYLYKKINSSMLCINSSNSFSRFCSHLNKIIGHPAHSIKKKKKKKVKNKTPENSKVLLLLWYLAPFFKLASQSSSGKKTF